MINFILFQMSDAQNKWSNDDWESVYDWESNKFDEMVEDLNHSREKVYF